MIDKLVLKKISEEQIDLLYKWVNDPECRRNSFQTEFIPYETHVKWCYDKIKTDDKNDVNELLGYVKFDNDASQKVFENCNYKKKKKMII